MEAELSGQGEMGVMGCCGKAMSSVPSGSSCSCVICGRFLSLAREAL